MVLNPLTRCLKVVSCIHRKMDKTPYCMCVQVVLKSNMVLKV